MRGGALINAPRRRPEPLPLVTHRSRPESAGCVKLGVARHGAVSVATPRSLPKFATMITSTFGLSAPRKRLAARFHLVAGTIVGLLAFMAPSALAAAGAALGYDDARHLLARTGFGPADADVRAYAALTREAAVAQLLRETTTRASTAPPASAVATTTLLLPRAEQSSVDERRAFIRQQIAEALELRGWWLREMAVTSSPLTERMTLFWHSHFVSAQPKVRVTRLMYRQNGVLRANALGNFGTLLHAIAKDPAMLVYLDGARNRAGAPNENFAREVMELFTLGEGHYTQTDVEEAARAFTGWSVNRETGEFVFRPMLHDYGEKTVFGETGRLDGDAVLDLLLARRDTAVYVTTKLWREFVSPEPDPVEVERIAARFRDSGYDIKTVLRELLLCDAFYAKENRGVLVKSPIELVVGALRSLGLEVERGVPFALAAAAMGQNVLSPPNVKGWPGGVVWINTATLLARKQFIDRVTRDAGAAPVAAEPAPDLSRMTMAPAEAKLRSDGEALRRQRLAREMERGIASLHFDGARFVSGFPGATDAARAAAVQRLLLAVEPQRPIDPDVAPADLVRSVMLDAAYQLK
jgi:uncharacterized protein (DUF1800 family)